MNNKVSMFLTFVFGASAGAGVTYYILKNKYEALIEEEVSSARETYQNLAKELAQKNEVEKQKMFTEYTEKVEGYINDAIVHEEPQQTIEEPVMNEVKPDDIPVKVEPIGTPANIYEIVSNEYGSNEDYDLVSLNYYSNEVLTDENDEVIDNVGAVIGEKLFEKLKVYEMNDIYTAYARNDTRRCDYEIFITGNDYVED